MNRTQLYQGIARYLTNALTSGTTPAFATVTRIMQDPSQLRASQLPMLILDESEERVKSQAQGVLRKYSLGVDVVIYTLMNQTQKDAGAETTVPNDALNAAIDAFEAAVYNPNAPQTLGVASIQHAEVDGKIRRINGIPSRDLAVSMAIVPLRKFDDGWHLERIVS